MSMLMNFLTFQAGWFATVLGAANGVPWMGPVVVLTVVGIHLRSAGKPLAEARLVAAAVLIGLVADSLLLATGWVAYPNGQWLAGLAPYWIVGLWALFATTLNVSLKWLSGRYLLAAAFGALGGPLSYLAGERLGAMTFVAPWAALAGLAIGWGLAMPLLMAIAAKTSAGARTPNGHVDSARFTRVDSHG